MTATILVVDDEEFIVEAISRHLSESGYEVEGLVKSSKALEAIKKNDFDMVITDLRMPDVSGIDLARAVHDKAADTQVIILTGHATLDSAIDSISLDVYSYLNKPFDLRELDQVVDRALTAQRLKRENEALRLRIGKMLDDISTLYEVTRFLYETDDWALTMESVLDTLSIGLGITHSCILLKAEGDRYTVGKANFPEGSALAERAAAYSWESLGAVVSSEEPTLLEVKGKTSQLPKGLFSKDEPLQGIFFVPIRYHESLLGFLAIFLKEGMAALSEDQSRLLQIVAIQLAPQVFQSIGKQLQDQTSWYSEAQLILRQQIDDSEDSDGPIGVNLLRFVTPRTLAAPEEMASFHQLCSEMLLRHEPEAQLHWLAADTALAFFPGANQVQSEITCTAMADEFGKSELDRVKTGGAAKLFHVSVAWPHDTIGTAEFLIMIWARLVEQIQQYTHKQLAVKQEDG
ncbi:MAG: response regulator [Fidelibacterota bacterium]|nr:MAG: response regulator [Candidatus Neomarinimicrobiota bacterium]